MCDAYIPILERRPRQTMPATFGWDSGALARTQERTSMDSLSARDLAPTVFKLYTEDVGNLPTIIARYFNSASIHHVTGLWLGVVEEGAIIEIVDAYQYRDKAIRLAADIADTNNQSEVIVTWQSSHGFEQVRVYGK